MMIRSALVLGLLATSSASAVGLPERCIDITFQKQNRWPGLTARQIYATLENANLDADIENLIQKPSVMNPLFRMNVPHKHERVMGFYESIIHVHGIYGIQTELGTTREDWQAKARTFFSREGFERLSQMLPVPQLMGAAISPEGLRKRLLEPRSADETGLGGLIKKFPEIEKVACLWMDPMARRECREAFALSFKNIYDSGNTYNIGNGWLVDILTSDRSAKGAFALVSKMLDRMTDGRVESGSFVEDAKQSFLEAGYSPVEAEKQSRDFIFLSIVHGQLSWESYRYSGLIQPYNHLTLSAAYMAAMLSATLDSLYTEKNGNLYTPAARIDRPCDDGKSYHSLVPWYMAQELRAAGYSPRTAAVIPFVFEWGYQMFSTSLGRDPRLNVTEDYNSARNQSHRLDLLFAGIGAISGASDLKRPLRFDQATLFRKTERAVLPFYRAGVELPPKMDEKKAFLKMIRVDLGRFGPRGMLRRISNAELN